MKYIMFEVDIGTLTKKVPVVFPNELVHREVAGVLVPMLHKQFGSCRCISAGEFSPITGDCSGRSSTMKLDSRGEEDSAIIIGCDYGAGLE